MQAGIFSDENGNRVFLVPLRGQKKKPVMVGRKYICSKLAITNGCLSKTPWHFPDFGEKIYGHYGAEPYTKEEVDEWLAIPAKVRRGKYKEWKENQ